MKIALSGCGGTGKSTLANEVGRRLNIPVIQEYAREIAAEMGIDNLRSMSPERTYEFQIKILERKTIEESKHHTFISDRSTADNIAYYLRWCSRDVSDERNAAYINRCIEAMKSYDRIIVLPWNSIPLENDGFRSSKLYYQYGIHCLILGILQETGITYEILKEPDMEKRVQYIVGLYDIK